MEEGLSQGLRVGVYVDFGSLGGWSLTFSFILFWGFFFQGIVSSLRRSKGNGFGFATEHRVKNYVCDTCMRISQKAELLLGNPDTVKETIRVIEEHYCSILQPGLKTKVSAN
jgi:hypothetical protein